MKVCVSLYVYTMALYLIGTKVSSSSLRLYNQPTFGDNDPLKFYSQTLRFEDDVKEKHIH